MYKLPDMLYVYAEQEGEDAYLICCETPRECSSLDEDRLVGIYELTGTGKVVVKVEVENVRIISKV